MSQLALAVSALAGIGVRFLTELVAHGDAPDWFKSGLTAGLSALAGGLSTVAFTDYASWSVYIVAVLYATAGSVVTRYLGVSDPVTRRTAGTGVGRRRGAHARVG